MTLTTPAQPGRLEHSPISKPLVVYLGTLSAGCIIGVSALNRIGPTTTEFSAQGSRDISAE